MHHSPPAAGESATGIVYFCIQALNGPYLVGGPGGAPRNHPIIIPGGFGVSRTNDSQRFEVIGTISINEMIPGSEPRGISWTNDSKTFKVFRIISK